MRCSHKRGNTIKNRTEVKLSMDLKVPIFTDARLGRSEEEKYQLVAYVVHHGLTPKSGHHTSHLVQEGRSAMITDRLS